MFKSIDSVKKEMNEGRFILANDGDYADVIILYRNRQEVLTADTHYIKSDDYNGYVHCLGPGCPACNAAKPLRVQSKLFIPLYVLSTTNGSMMTPVNELQFWDRSFKFDQQLQTFVFKNFANPAEYVFRITRCGAAGDINTKYDIRPVGTNHIMPFDTIMSTLGIKFPDAYERICKAVDAPTMNGMLTAPAAANTSTYGGINGLPEYVATPRVAPNTATAFAANLDSIPAVDAVLSATDNDGIEELEEINDEPDFD